MGELFRRLYERYRMGFIYATIAVAYVGICLVVFLAAFVFARTVELSSWEMWRIVIAVSAVSAVTITLTTAYVLRRYPHLVRWARVGPAPEEAARIWLDIASLPRVVIRTYVIGMLPAAVLAMWLTTAPVSEESAASILLRLGGAGTALIYLLAWGRLLSTLALRPGMEEVSLYLPADFTPPSPDSGTRAMIVDLLSVSFVCGTFVAGLAAEKHVGAESGLAFFGYGLGAAAVFGLPVTALLVERILAPTRMLTKGTQSVAAGDLTARVPLISDDEQGRLNAGFNIMVAELAETSEELRASRARIVAVGDAERRRLERDIHDGAQQRLVMLQLKASQIQRKLADHPEVAAMVQELRDDAAQALDELRDLAHGIYPAVLETDGLAAALEEAAQRAVIPTSVSADGAGRYAPELEAAVYFCCLEALQNAGKYAGEGARATIELASRTGNLEFAVSDDGAGFDPSTIEATHGVQNMTDRIGALGGMLTVESAPGSGTRVTGTVPVGTER